MLFRSPLLPFPPRAIPNKKMEEAEKEILETFRKVEVSIPLQDAIIPYALNLNLSLNLHTCHSLCIESESEFDFDPVFDFYDENEFEFESGSNFMGVVPLDVDFLESECTNHVTGSTYTSDLHYKVKVEEPSSSPTLVPPTV